jgi:hypothetical protein
MRQIYERAMCAIAVNASKVDQGLFCFSSGYWLSFRRRNSRLHPGLQGMLWGNLIKEGPLEWRAWCLQERYPSRRILSVHDSTFGFGNVTVAPGLVRDIFAENASDAYRRRRLRTLTKTSSQPRPWILIRPKKSLYSSLYSRHTFKKQF